MKLRGIQYGLLLLIFIFSFTTTTGILNAQQTRSDLDLMYMKALNAYYAKNYAESISIFRSIQGMDPNYRSTQIKRYIRVAETQLGKGGVKQTFRPAEEKTTEVEVLKEGELETLAMVSQKALLDAYEYLDEMEKKHQIPVFEMTEPKSTMAMAKKAYEDKQFTEAIRLANKARLQIDQIIQKRAEIEKPVLGEIGKTPITLNLNNADLEQTLKLIYDLTGANIVMSKGITGRVTINIQDLPLQKVLDLICEANKLKYLEEDKVIKIMNEDEYNARTKIIKEKSRRVFNIFYGDAALIAKSLRETFKLDTIVHDPRTNSILVDVYNPTLLQQIQDVISSLDMPISQVLLEAKIVEIALSGTNSFSIDWLISSRLVDAIDATLTGPKFGDNPSYIPGISSSLPSGGFSFGLSNKDVNTLISALATKGEVKLVQAPKIMCLNGTTALIRVVQNFPYIIPEYEQTYNPTTGAVTGTRQTVTVYEEDVGTEFEVTPIIQRNRTVFLTMNIYDSRLVEVRKLTAVAAGLTYSTEQPIISTRETTQNVTLFDGQTLVIGGMIQQRQEKSETGVPFLRRIPLLGYLFKKPTYTTSNSELVLFLTPYIVTTYQEADIISKPEIEKSNKEIKGGLLEKF
ncbi:MAG: hypothetical protein NC905_04305 [Candidatus Omnitrophica bacterium]|nr:hypothetical protein [Candidatus Omnitrophota bacterium]